MGRGVYEVPVGFKWFVDGLVDGSLGFVGEESADAGEVPVPQPRDPLALIGTEPALQPRRIGALGRRPALQEIGERDQAFIAADDRQPGLGDQPDEAALHAIGAVEGAGRVAHGRRRPLEDEQIGGLGRRRRAGRQHGQQADRRAAEPEARRSGHVPVYRRAPVRGSPEG